MRRLFGLCRFHRLVALRKPHRYLPAVPLACGVATLAIAVPERTTVTCGSPEKSRGLSSREARQVVDLLHMTLFDDETEDIPLYDIATEEEHAVEKSGGDSTYGELSYDAIDWALEVMKESWGLEASELQEVLCDLGSGGGRALLYLALRTGCPAIGVELSPTRHASAEKLGDLASLFLEAPLELHEADIANSDGPQRKGTIVLFANKLFEEEFSEQVLQTVDRLKVLLALKPVPSLEKHLKRTGKLPTSWSRSQPMYLYLVE